MLAICLALPVVSIIANLIEDIRQHSLASLYKSSEGIALFDMLTSFANCAVRLNYCMLDCTSAPTSAQTFNTVTLPLLLCSYRPPGLWPNAVHPPGAAPHPRGYLGWQAVRAQRHLLQRRQQLPHHHRHEHGAPTYLRYCRKLRRALTQTYIFSLNWRSQHRAASPRT